MILHASVQAPSRNRNVEKKLKKNFFTFFFYHHLDHVRGFLSSIGDLLAFPIGSEPGPATQFFKMRCMQKFEYEQSHTCNSQFFISHGDKRDNNLYFGG